uniref:inorganic diphosphatase n=1 Tax=Rhodosorus marinus TaxID=101924 RepID=A0A7S2ZCP5_9RHOD|mmetsp:Transcript_14856/g.60400  ORF Transcript_14856/g.60400 Transcript_14856/m.60400 type:complete len:654 (+) Transcript_14856:121-2082(+)
MVKRRKGSTGGEEATAEKKSKMCLGNSEYSVVRGPASEGEIKFYYQKDGTGIINPLNDIPLFADKEKGILNMVVEIPKETNAKLELKTGDPLSPIIQDEKKGKKRYVHNVFPYKGYIWNYGCFPQTWENPTEVHMETGALGDGDPLDVCEIGSAIASVGEVKQVKVLGVLGMIDEGEMDWKVIVIDVNDPQAPLLNDVEDLKTMMPGLLHATFSWFRTYKIPDGKPINVFAFRENVQPAEYAMDIVKECHTSWQMVLDGKLKHKKVNPANTTLNNSFTITSEQAEEMLAQSGNDMNGSATGLGERQTSLVDLRTVPLPDFQADNKALAGKPMMTVKRFCMEMQRRFPHGSNDLSLLMTELGVAFKCIRSFLRDAPNAEFSTLLEFANTQMHASLAASGLCCMIFSSQYKATMPIEEGSDQGNYIVVFNPLTGATGGTLGTIFSVYSRKSSAGSSGDSSDLLSRTGYEQVAAGYCIYASYTALVLSMGYGTHIFLLDSISGHFVISQQHVKIPKTGPVYSINTAQLSNANEPIRKFVAECDEESSGKFYRYEDNVVANFHRVLTSGGVMMKAGPSGEDLATFLGMAAPLAYIARQAGGRASVGKRPVLELNSWNLDMAVPLYIGSADEVSRIEELFGETKNEILVDPEHHLRVE